MKKPERGKDRMDPHLAKCLFQDTIDCLNEMDLKYWIDYGTLLGAIREDDFIADDMDIDICVHATQYDLEKMINNLTSKGLVYSPDYFHVSDHFSDHSLMRKANIVVNGKKGFAKLEIVPVYKVDDMFYKLTKADGLKVWGAGIPSEFIGKLLTLRFKNRWVKIPEFPIDLLLYNYGDWTTPRTDIAQSYKNPFPELDYQKLIEQLL